MMSKLAVCNLSSEAPFNCASVGISRFLPGIDFGYQGIAVGNSSIQALSVEDSNLDLCNVEPARVLGRVVKLHAPQEFVGRPPTQHIIEAFSEVGVEVVHHQVNAACPCIL